MKVLRVASGELQGSGFLYECYRFEARGLRQKIQSVRLRVVRYGLRVTCFAEYYRGKMPLPR